METLMFLMEWTVRGTLVLMLAWAATALLRRGRPATRHAVWSAALAALLFLPLMLWALPRWSWQVLPAATTTIASDVGAGQSSVTPASNSTPSLLSLAETETARVPQNEAGATEPATGLAPERASVASTPSRITPQASRSATSASPFWPWLFVSAWSLLTLLVLVRLLAGLGRLRQLRRNGQPLAETVAMTVRACLDEQGGGRQPQVLQTCELASPVTFGLLRPVVLLPEAARSWSPGKLRAALVHELAHVRRFDWPLQILGQVVGAAFWFHPLVWLAQRRLHLEQERACDDAVLAQGARASDYAGYLRDMSTGSAGRMRRRLAAGVVSAPGELMQRMLNILDDRPRAVGRGRRLQCAGLVVGLLSSCGLLAALDLVPEPGVVVAAPQDPPKKSGSAPEKKAQDKPPASKPSAEKSQDKSSDESPNNNKDTAALARRLVGLLDLQSHRKVTIAELGRLGAPALPALRQAIADRRPEVARAALTAVAGMDWLAEVRHEVPRLVAAIHRREIRATALRTLLALRSVHRQTAELLLAELDKASPPLATEILVALDQMPRPAFPSGYRAGIARQTKRGDKLLTQVARRFLKFQASFLVADYSDNRVVVLGSDGHDLFAIKDLFGVWDCEMTKTGTILVTEFSMNRVSERTKKGEIVWKFDDLKNPYDADRLASGNTLIADTYGRRVIELNRKKEIVWKYDKNVQPFDVDRLSNGNTLIVDAQADRVIEVDPQGKIVWQVKSIVNCHDADRLADGSTLLTIRMGNEVRLVGRTGGTLWRLQGLSSPSDADMLPNGDLVVAENGMIRIFQREGALGAKMRWKERWRRTVTWAVEVNTVK